MEKTAVENKKEFAETQVELWKEKLEDKRYSYIATKQIAAWQAIINSCDIQTEMEKNK